MTIRRVIFSVLVLVLGCCLNTLAIPHFLTSPFKDANIKIQQGWIYVGDSNQCGHQGIDYIKGTIDSSSTWSTFEVYPAADGVATLHTSSTYGDYVTITHAVEGVTYYTLYAHLDPTQRKLSLESATPVTRNRIIGMSGKSGTASGNVLHLHFELSKNGFARDECAGGNKVNECGTCRLDPYGIYGQRPAYPNSQTSTCLTGENYWINCPPTAEPAECSNGSSEVFLINGKSPVHPNGTIIKVGNQAAVYVLNDGRARFIPSRAILNSLYGFGKGFDFRDVITISPEEFARYPQGASVSSALSPNGRNEPDGRLIKPKTGSHLGEISIVTNNGNRRPFASFTAFQGLGYRECNVAAVDDYDNYPFDYTHGLPVEAMLVVSGNLTITPNGPYTTAQTLTGRFQLRNVGSAGAWVDTITCGGRLNGDNSGTNGFPDFTIRRSLPIPPGQTLDYEGTLVPQIAGDYSFFVAYKDTNGYWSTTVARDSGVNAEKNITVDGTIIGAGSTDFFGPKVALFSHTDRQTVIDASVLVRGSVSDANEGNSGIARVTVNGQRADNDTVAGSGSTEWSKTIPLTQGLNTITIVAVDGSLNQNETTQKFTLDCQPLKRYTIEGRITDRSGVPLGNVDVVFGAARFRPNDAFTNAEGRFVIDSAYEGFSWGVIPIKQGYYFVPRSQVFETINANQTANFTSALVPTAAPIIQTEEGTTHALTLSSQHFLRDPLPLTTQLNFGQDLRTRMMIFARNVDLRDGDIVEPRDIYIDAQVNRNGQVTGFGSLVEYVGKVPGFNDITCIVFMLSDSPDLYGDVRIQIRFMGLVSNEAFLSVRPPP
jgi:hypothetical protein